eukprot:TRINITY_DN29047_c0_g1_i1.p1 TRINITY_DN29047_c0_g1~~TRINITY_DN29047_c0_g1_i1.p1  ORF type:complete len:1549 (+),score=250.81 TRINITY_DN29047_c0_g1_i1:66-4649(+)
MPPVRNFASTRRLDAAVHAGEWRAAFCGATKVSPPAPHSGGAAQRHQIPLDPAGAAAAVQAVGVTVVRDGDADTRVALPLSGEGAAETLAALRRRVEDAAAAGAAEGCGALFFSRGEWAFVARGCISVGRTDEAVTRLGDAAYPRQRPLDAADHAAALPLHLRGCCGVRELHRPVTVWHGGTRINGPLLLLAESMAHAARPPMPPEAGGGGDWRGAGELHRLAAAGGSSAAAALLAEGARRGRIGHLLTRRDLRGDSFLDAAVARGHTAFAAAAVGQCADYIRSAMPGELRRIVGALLRAGCVTTAEWAITRPELAAGGEEEVFPICTSAAAQGRSPEVVRMLGARGALCYKRSGVVPFLAPGRANGELARAALSVCPARELWRRAGEFSGTCTVLAGEDGPDGIAAVGAALRCAAAAAVLRSSCAPVAHQLAARPDSPAAVGVLLLALRKGLWCGVARPPRRLGRIRRVRNLARCVLVSPACCAAAAGDAALAAECAALGAPGHTEVALIAEPRGGGSSVSLPLAAAAELVAAPHVAGALLDVGEGASPALAVYGLDDECPWRMGGVLMCTDEAVDVAPAVVAVVIAAAWLPPPGTCIVQLVCRRARRELLRRSPVHFAAGGAALPGSIQRRAFDAAGTAAALSAYFLDGHHAAIAALRFARGATGTAQQYCALPWPVPPDHRGSKLLLGARYRMYGTFLRLRRPHDECGTAVLSPLLVAAQCCPSSDVLDAAAATLRERVSGAQLGHTVVPWNAEDAPPPGGRMLHGSLLTWSLTVSHRGLWEAAWAACGDDALGQVDGYADLWKGSLLEYALQRRAVYALPQLIAHPAEQARLRSPVRAAQLLQGAVLAGEHALAAVCGALSFPESGGGLSVENIAWVLLAAARSGDSAVDAALRLLPHSAAALQQSAGGLLLEAALRGSRAMAAALVQQEQLVGPLLSSEQVAEALCTAAAQGHWDVLAALAPLHAPHLEPPLLSAAWGPRCGSADLVDRSASRYSDSPSAGPPRFSVRLLSSRCTARPPQPPPIPDSTPPDSPTSGGGDLSQRSGTGADVCDDQMSESSSDEWRRGRGHCCLAVEADPAVAHCSALDDASGLFGVLPQLARLRALSAAPQLTVPGGATPPRFRLAGGPLAADLFDVLCGGDCRAAQPHWHLPNLHSLRAHAAGALAAGASVVLCRHLSLQGQAGGGACTLPVVTRTYAEHPVRGWYRPCPYVQVVLAPAAAAQERDYSAVSAEVRRCAAAASCPCPLPRPQCPVLWIFAAPSPPGSTAPHPAGDSGAGTQGGGGAQYELLCVGVETPGEGRDPEADPASPGTRLEFHRVCRAGGRRLTGQQGTWPAGLVEPLGSRSVSYPSEWDAPRLPGHAPARIRQRQSAPGMEPAAPPTLSAALLGRTPTSAGSAGAESQPWQSPQNASRATHATRAVARPLEELLQAAPPAPPRVDHRSSPPPARRSLLHSPPPPLRGDSWLSAPPGVSSIYDPSLHYAPDTSLLSSGSPRGGGGAAPATRRRLLWSPRSGVAAAAKV